MPDTAPADRRPRAPREAIQFSTEIVTHPWRHEHVTTLRMNTGEVLTVAEVAEAIGTGEIVHLRGTPLEVKPCPTCRTVPYLIAGPPRLPFIDHDRCDRIVHAVALIQAELRAVADDAFRLGGGEAFATVGQISALAEQIKDEVSKYRDPTAREEIDPDERVEIPT